jgi:hypothetical protein
VISGFVKRIATMLVGIAASSTTAISWPLRLGQMGNVRFQTCPNWPSMDRAAKIQHVFEPSNGIDRKKGQ